MARARVTRGVLYHRFRDKTGLFGAVMQTVAGELAQRLIAQQLSRGPGDAVGAWTSCDKLRPLWLAWNSRRAVPA